MALGDVPDVELQRLRHLPVGGEKVQDFLPSHATIEPAAQGSVRDAVDTGQARGLEVGDGFEPLVGLRIERAGNQDGHIRLDEEVIDRVGGEAGGGFGAVDKHAGGALKGNGADPLGFRAEFGDGLVRSVRGKERKVEA